MHQIWAIDPDSTPGVYVLLPTRKQSRRCARGNYSPLARKGDVTCTPSSSKGRLKLARKKNSRRHGETKFSLRLKSRPDSWMRCCFLKPRGVGLSFWKRQEDAERYHREVFPQLVNSLQHLIETAPTVRSFTLEAAETFRVSVG